MAPNLAPFFDDVNLWTYKPAKGREHEFLKKRMALRKARRFRFDKELGQTIYDLAVAEHGERLREWMSLARLPYDVVWLENDEYLDGEVTREGCLMQRLDGDPTRWLCETYLMKMVSEANPLPFMDNEFAGMVIVNPLMLLVDTEGRLGKEPHGIPRAPATASEEFPMLFPVGFDHLIWAFKDKYEGRKLPKRVTLERPWFADHVHAVIEPALGRPTLREVVQDLRNGSDPDLLGEFHDHFMPMIDGAFNAFKFMLVAMATINDVPTNMTTVAQRPGSRASGANRVPYLDHSVVSLRIPAKRPDRWLKRRLDHSVIRKKAHEVRGHWRTYLDRESGEVRRKVWIDAHNRGDPSLGTVRPTFRLSGPGPNRNG